ncbi:putative bifunctional diguanylate cyclase/phosphodiesterase [Paraglaciecola aestuariivivens]
MNILIVDDDEIDTALVKNALASALNAEHHIEVADSVKKGIELIDSKAFDVILLDYHLPEVNGIEMIIDIRSRPHLGNTAIIVISAAQNHEIELECIEAGAQDFISKTEVSHLRLHKAIIHSKKRFELEQKMQASYLAIKTMAETDQLTGLYNRYYFNENLRFMTESCKRSGLSVGMLALDIDNFKHINDSLGHQAGDQLLIAFVARIKECLRTNDGFSRLGGDEFAITLPEIHSLDEVNNVASRILNSTHQPFVIEGNRINCSLSIGAALYPNDAKNQVELVKCADIAMYRAKQQGKNTIRFYESHYQREFNRQFVIQNTISDIVKQSNFRLFYQPIFHAHQDNIKGVEALIRWPDTQPFYTPDEFIPIAEESRLINKIGLWVINTSFKQLAYWQKTYDKSLSLSINISAVQLQDADLVDILLSEAKKYGISPKSIILEITETALLNNNEQTLIILNELSAVGFVIALDDFGMGYSSISHLHSYPIDIVKLDKSLQETEGKMEKRKGVLEAVALMLKLLDFIVIAEGIETDTQLSMCHRLKIDRIQGYLLGKPAPANEIENILENSK